MGARYYDAALARFFTPDPEVPDPFSPQALNRYSYVFNAPTLFVDPTGRQGDLHPEELVQVA